MINNFIRDDATPGNNCNNLAQQESVFAQTVKAGPTDEENDESSFLGGLFRRHAYGRGIWTPESFESAWHDALRACGERDSELSGGGGGGGS